MHACFHTKRPICLSDFKQNWIWSTDFSTDIHIEIMKLKVAFCNCFVNAPKKCSLLVCYLHFLQQILLCWQNLFRKTYYAHNPNITFNISVHILSDTRICIKHHRSLIFNNTETGHTYCKWQTSIPSNRILTKISFFCAVIIVPFAGLDMWGMMHTVSKTDFIKMTVKVLESYLSTGTEQAQKFGQAATKVVCIMDMENFNIRQYAWRPGKYHIRISYLWQSMKSLHITLKRIRKHLHTTATNRIYQHFSEQNYVRFLSELKYRFLKTM